jgi:hypothetical protein
LNELKEEQYTNEIKGYKIKESAQLQEMIGFKR